MPSVTKSVAKPLWQRSLIILSAVVTAALILAALYWMRTVFIPIALAVFLASVLAPLVSFVQRRGVGRLWAVVIVVVLAVGVAVGTLGVMATQLAGLSNTVKDKRQHITDKVASLKTAVLGDGKSEWAKVSEDMEKLFAPAPATTEQVPQPVVVKPAATWTSYLEGYASPLTELIGHVTFAFILAVFVLLAKEDLQDRVLRLMGVGSMASAVRASGETNMRVSRYLFAQLVLNVIFGVICTIGLWLMGVQYFLLWGLLATVMRYVPYLGTWIGVLPPALFAAIMAEGDYWYWQPIGVLVLFLGLELLSNNLIEPRLYGTSLGVSEVALLVTAAFWTFLWGPIGLVLSGPLTMFLVVVGKHTPQFRFLAVLLGSEPPLTPAQSLYQRLTARNQDEAERVVVAAIPKDDPRAVFDAVVIPALSLVKQARNDGQMEGDDERQVTAIATEVVESTVLEVRRRAGDDAAEPADGRRVRVLACPASDETDRLSLEAFAGLLPAARWEVRVTGVDTLTSELLQQAAEFEPDVICIAALPPSGVAHVRYLCKRLRARLPDVHILVGRWGGPVSAEETAQFTEAGATAVTESLSAARASLAGWQPVFAAQDAPAEAVGTTRKAEAAVGTLPA